MSPSSLKLYEAQFFGFIPQTCMVRVYRAFQDFLNELLLVVEAVFVRKLSGTDPNGEQLCSRARECSQKLQIFLQERFKRLTCLMGTVLVNNVLSVPPNVLLPDDQPHKKYFQCLEEVLNLESSLAELQLVYQAEVCGRQALLAELEEQREVQEQLDGILRWIVELQAAWMQEGMASFHDSFHVMM
ncbi:protein MIS12 homolog [Oncorhynchus kisutch]|uniref:protein MIS12 homolog n=1 Tax=Oncorhynchus kisutch TaxID=8019 RepID=UPI00099F8ED2|nr:protein MIS12 homolog [Oncorhynchus kisutch]